MKINRAVFAQALAAMSKVVSKGGSLIVRNVLLEARGGELILVGTDLTTTLRLRIPAFDWQGTAECIRVTAPVPPLQKVVKALPKDVKDLAVELGVQTRGEGEHAVTEAFVIVNGTRVFGLPADEYPELQEAKAAAVAVPHLIPALELVAPVISRDETRRSIHGARLDVEAGHVIGTDGHRLHFATMPPGAKAPRVTIPRDAVEVLLAVAVKRQYAGAVVVEVETDDAVAARRLAQKDAPREPQGLWLTVLLEQGTLTTRLGDDAFPTYEAVIPKTSTVTLTAGRQTLIDAVTQAKAVANDRNSPVEFTLERGRVTIGAETPELGRTTVPVPGAIFEGVPADHRYVFGINAGYLLSTLETCEGHMVTVQMTEPLAPLRIDDDSLVAVLMPMRTGRDGVHAITAETTPSAPAAPAEMERAA